MQAWAQQLAQAAEKLSKSQKLLAQFVTAHQQEVAFMSSFALAAVTGVSQSTVMRFATCLGFSGYADFQAALRKDLSYTLDAGARIDLLAQYQDPAQLAEAIARTDAAHMQKNAHAWLDIERNALVERLNACKAIYLYGQGNYSFFALYMAEQLRLLHPNVRALNGYGDDPLRALSGIEQGDVLLLISFPLHSETTRRLLSYAGMRGAWCVGICEGVDSALAPLCDEVIVCECGHYGLAGSPAPLLSLLSTLVCLLAQEDKDARKKWQQADEAAAWKGEY